MRNKRGRPSSRESIVRQRRHRALRLEMLESRMLMATLPTAYQMHSNPNAAAKLFLDFDGHVESFWGGFNNVITPAFDQDGDPNTFSSGELAAIQEIWSRVAEDYAPFNVDVTTVDPLTKANKVSAEIAIGGSYSDWYGPAVGGISFVGGFTNPQSNVGYVFSTSLGGTPKYVAEAAAHEAGHLFGLQHQSVWNGSTLVNEYNPGSGDWAPLMGVSYDAPRSTWYSGIADVGTGSPHVPQPAPQDDMTVIANTTSGSGLFNNGFGYKADDFGNTTATASPLPITGTTVNFPGLIGQNNDQDVWFFTTPAGQLNFQLNVAPVGPNLDAVLELDDSSGHSLVVAAPTSSYNASITTTVAAGTYYLLARSNGDYGDVGQYTISGSLPPAGDTTPPTAALNAVLPTPRNSAVGSIGITFSEAVTGVDLSDFRLTRDGANVPLTGVAFSGSGAAYSIDLSSVTTQAGNYVFTLVAATSGITDLAGNALTTNASDTWSTDLTPPTVALAAITPNPRNSPVSSLSITFSEPVSGLDLSDFQLTRDGIPVILTGAVLTPTAAPLDNDIEGGPDAFDILPENALTGYGTSYMLDLSSVTTAAGTYVLTLAGSGSGIIDAAGNALSPGGSDGWTTDTTPPTAAIAALTPTPRNTAVGTVNLSLSETVTGVDIGDFSLTRNGTAVSLAGLFVNGSTSNYTLNLASVTASAGSYVLTLNASGSGIADSAGNLLAASAATSWTMDVTPPTAALAAISPNPRNSAVADVGITFSESITGLDIGDLSLTRNGSFVSLHGVSVTGSGAAYTINLATITGSAGNYAITLVASGSGIADAAGNPLGVNASTSWQTDTTPPTASLAAIVPSPRNNAVGNVGITFSESVSGVDISDFSLTRDGNPVSLAGLTVSGSGSIYALNVASLTGTSGSYVLTLTASGSGITDSAGNLLAASVSDGWVTDTTGPTIALPDGASMANPVYGSTFHYFRLEVSSPSLLP